MRFDRPSQSLLPLSEGASIRVRIRRGPVPAPGPASASSFAQKLVDGGRATRGESKRSVVRVSEVRSERSGLRIAGAPLSLLEARLAGHGCQGPSLLGIAVVAVATDDRVVVVTTRPASASTHLSGYDLIDPVRDAGGAGVIDPETAARRVLCRDLGRAAEGAHLESIGVWFDRSNCVILFVARLAGDSPAAVEAALAAGGGAITAETRDARRADAKEQDFSHWDMALADHLRSATPLCEDQSVVAEPVSQLATI